MTEDYIPRIMDSILETHLKFSGAVLIRGPKWCGKTTTAERASKSSLKMQDPQRARKYAAMADLTPLRLLKGKTPRLIDEWQMAPTLWDAVRSEVDRRNKPGQFILTGSTEVDWGSVMHSGIGRINPLDMHTMSLFESRESNGTVSLRSLFDGEEPDSENELTLENIAYATCRGGWPASLFMEKSSALKVSQSYFKMICETGIGGTDAASRDPHRVRAFLRSYARNVSTLTKNRIILEDIVQSGVEMTEQTMYSYISALKRLFVIEDTPAWNPSVRSATSMRSLDKKGFNDPSIATAALRLGPEALLDDPETFGLFFECLCMRDLRVYSSGMDGHISYYRDRYGLECDAVLHRENGDYALIEIKLGGDKGIREGTSNLLTMRDLLAENDIRPPSFLMVLVGDEEYAYRDGNGVNIVPIGCLRD